MVWLLTAMLLSVWACWAIARLRGANVVFWVVLAILIGPLAVPFAFFAQPDKAPQER